MRNPATSPFGAIFKAEVLLNTKRIAPYAMVLLCGGNALLWWGWGPATGRGIATNSEFFIAGVLPVYSFMTLPLFTALLMADPVNRDFRTGVAPLIFSKPVSRAEYLLGKFFGSFFVLACCQSAFVLTLFVLQAFRRPGMVVLEVKAFPYLKHFVVLVVISHLVLAAFYFTIGTLTRNAKIVYGLGVAFYPVYIFYQTGLLKGLPHRWRAVLDPLVMNWHKYDHNRSAELANQLIVTYDANLIINRVLMILIAAVFLAILYMRFTMTERSHNPEKFSLLNLSTAAERPYYDTESLLPTRAIEFERPRTRQKELVPLPSTDRAAPGIRTTVSKLISAVGTELRLLRAERSFIVLVPLIIFVCIFDLAFYRVVPDPSYYAVYASKTAKALLLFLLGLTVFYAGEAMHRDRELRILPVLWATPMPNSVLLLSKFVATVLLGVALMLLIGAIAIATQIVKGDTPVNISAYLITYSVILFPSVVFISAAAIALNVLLRDKYFAYAVTIGISIGLLYLYGQGFNHWLYNPLLYGLWNYVDLTGAGSGLRTILINRLYCLAIAGTCLLFAHLFFQRKN